MLKDFIENCKRTNADAQENNSPALLWGPNGSGKDTTWKNLVTGNIIKVKRGEFIPADLLILYSSNDKADCYLETKNLDGETNLKMKVVSEKIREIVKEENDVANLVGFNFDFEEPNPFLYTFNGRLTNEGGTIAAEPKSFLLRGCLLKNTNFVIGVVSFTGHCTKIMMNSIKTKPKKSHLEVTMGWQILTIFLLLVGFCVVASVLYVTWLNETDGDIGYLKLGSINLTVEFFTRLGNWILIFG